MQGIADSKAQIRGAISRFWFRYRSAQRRADNWAVRFHRCALRALIIDYRRIGPHSGESHDATVAELAAALQAWCADPVEVGK